MIFNSIEEKDHLILLYVKKVIIINLFEDKIYAKIIIDSNSIYFNGYIYSKDYNNYLCFSSINGLIMIYDLFNTDIFKRITCPK